MMDKGRAYFSLLGAFFIYSFAPIFSKIASKYEFLSWGYLCGFGSTVLVLGVYAVLWQQIIKRVPISNAYMFKGISILFVLLLSHVFFGETITVWNGIGATLIISGIALYAYS